MAQGLCAAALLLVSPLLFADGAPVLETVPLTGAYTAHHVTDRDHISIIELAGNYNEKLDNGTGNLEPRAVIAREFFRTHPDEYDFLVAFSTFEYNTGEALAFHWGVQNKVLGIGTPIYDNTTFFGSQGKLQGFIDMAALTRYATDPLNPNFEKVLSTLAHEMLHQWAAGVRFKDASGNLSSALLGKDNAHWSFLLNSNASVEYGNLWKDNGDGTFTSTGTRKFYSPLDLYLMGFYKPEEVPPFYLIENPSIDKTRLPEENITISGTQRWVTIEEIIAAEGPRIPAAAEAQKDFRIAFVLLTGPGQQVSDAQIAALNNVRNAYMTRFAVLTGGRGVAQIHPEAMPTVTAGTPSTVNGDALRTDPASLDDALAWLRNQQKPEGHWLDKATTDVRDTTLTLQALTKLDPAFTNAASSLTWLNQKPSRNTDYLARYAIALHDIGSDAAALRTQLASRQNSDGGFGIAPGYQSDPLDTALALQALAGGSETSATKLDSAVQYLLGKQNSDGGFSPAEGGPSRTSVTAAALTALKAMNKHATVAPTALAFLTGKQNPDGGFGDSPSTVHDTANALQTFMAFDALTQISADGAADFLLGRQTVSGSWEGSVYSTASAVMALKRFKYPNWAVLSVSAEPATVGDGNRIQLTVRVRNDSNVTAPEGRLRVYDGDPSQGGVAIGPDITIPAMAGGTELMFTPIWDSFDKAGSHSLYAVVDPDNGQTEMSERDNHGSVSVTVQQAPPGVDLSFGEPGIAISPVQPNRLPTTLSITVAVRNLGMSDVQNARVILWEGEPGSGTLVGESTLDVLGRSTVLANFTHVLKRPGRTVFTAQVDPTNSIVEASETNNVATAAVTTAPSVDLVVLGSDISVDKNPAVVGDDITFKVTLRNEGTSDTPSTEVKYFVTDGNTTREVMTNSVQLAAGQSIEQSVTWRVDLSGELTFTAQIDPSGSLPELEEGNNSATFNFAAGEPSGINLAISYKDLIFAPNPGREGYAAILSVLVRNTGTVAASNAEIAFYNGDPSSGGTHLGSHIIASLAAGETTQATFTWPAIPNVGDKLIYVMADPANALNEFAEDDNSAFNVLPVLSLPDLAISEGDVTLTPLFPKAGDSVSVTVRVANLGAQEANDIAVRLYNGDPATGGTLIGETAIAQIAGYGTGFAELSWTPTEAKLYPLVIQVDPANAIQERTKTNNSVRREILIQDGDLSVTQKYFSPNGDGIKDTTELFFRVQGAGTAKVEVVNKRDKVVRSFSVPVTASSSGASITWDGLDDLGRLVQDGPYRLRVIDTHGATFGEVVVQLDTNRSSLLEAAGTKYESYTNLTCDLPDISGFAMTNDDSKVFFTIPSALPDAIYQKGVYRMEGDGTDVKALVPNTWPNFAQFIPSDLLVAGSGSRFSFRLNTMPESYWVADEDGRSLGALNYTPALGSTAYPWRITQDGNTVYLIDYNSQQAVSQLIAVPNGGFGQPRVVIAQAGELQQSEDSVGRYDEIEPNDVSAIYDSRFVSSPTMTQKLESLGGEISVNAAIGNPGGEPVWDVDYYSFNAKAGDSIKIIGGAYTNLSLYKPSTNYSSGIELDWWTGIHPYDAMLSPSIYRTLPVSGTYVVAVRPNSAWTVRYFYWDGRMDGWNTNAILVPQVEYTLEISGISSSSNNDYSSANRAFSPDESKVALITQDGNSVSTLRIGDLTKDTHITPTIDGVELGDIRDMQWSPNSKYLGISRSGNNQVVVFNRNGNLERQFAIPEFDGGGSVATIKNLSWSSSGTEVAFKAYTQIQGGIYIADVITGNVEKVVAFRSNSTDTGLDSSGILYWVPGERSLIYRDIAQRTVTAILLDENNSKKPIFSGWPGDFSKFDFSPTGRQIIFGSDRAAKDPTSACYQQGRDDYWSFKSLLNLTADLRAIRSAKTGGIQLKGTAADANFAKYQLDYAPVEAPDDWHPIAPPASEMVVDSLFTTWVPPGPGNYLARLTVEDLAGNVRHTIKRVSWSDTPSITDVYRTPAVISPNGDGVVDNAIIHYRVLEPVHLTFEFFNENGTRVRVINRDHSAYGIETELLWDGRDTNGLIVPDGRYRMTVQNYEFFVMVDNTPPETLIKIRDAYQSAQVADPSNPNAKSLIVSVEPGIYWQAKDPNLDRHTIESGAGAEPFEWNETSLGNFCNLLTPPGENDPSCNTLRLAEYTEHRFRIEAFDTAGNRNVSMTSLPSEQLIVYGFGNHKKMPCDSTSVQIDCTSQYYRLESVPYVPMTDTNGGTRVSNIGLDAVRFRIAETVGRPIAQLNVQFRPASDPVWRESALNKYTSYAGLSGDYEKLIAIDSPKDQGFDAVWDLAGVNGGITYVVRLHAVDTSGQEHYSNTFRIYTDGLTFLGRNSSTLPADVKARLLSENPPEAGDTLLWGEEFITEEIEKVRLIVSSTDDPRYAVAQEIGSVSSPDSAFLFRTKELQTCKTYTGYLEVTTVPRLNPASGAVVSRTVRSGSQQIKMPCLALRVKSEQSPATVCGEDPKNEVEVKFAPSALDGVTLKLLTLSQPLPNNGGEDVLYNINNPTSVSLPPAPAEPNYTYTYKLNTSQYPEGLLNLTAKLLNVDDEETVVAVPIMIDRTPPVAHLTYPLEGQRLCGVPKQMADGTIRNTLTFEGELSDAGGFDYALDLGVGSSPATFETIHDSNSKDSFKTPSAISPPRAPYGQFSLFGPIGQIYDGNGEFTVRLSVVDAGGYMRCDTRTFYFDGLVEGARAHIDRRLFSPNGDEQYDDVTVTYGADEAVTIDVNLYRAVAGGYGNYQLDGEVLRTLQSQVTLLEGESQISWDGRDGVGSLVADGWYGLSVTIKDACGNSRTINTFVEVDTTAPTVSIAYPKSTDQLPLTVEIQGAVNDLHLLNYGVDISTADTPESWMRLATATANTQGTKILANWNTYGLEGSYTVRLIAIDAVGNASSVEVPVTLLERVDLIGYLEVLPDLFSPNQDGKLESTGIRLGLEQNALVTLSILDAAGALKKTLYDAQPFNAGPFSVSWDGTDNAGKVLPDGRYTVALLVASAANPLLRQEEKVTVLVDQTAPAIDVTRPANGFISANGNIIGTIQDAHIVEYDVSLTSEPASPVWMSIDSGTENRLNTLLGSVNDQEEGDYALKVEAVDLGETRTVTVIPFVIDRTPPKVEITAPERNMVVGHNKSPINVTGTLEESYLAKYVLSVGNGAAPSTWAVLATGTSLPLPPVIHAWDISAANDGVYTLQLRGEDKAGNAAESQVSITVDNTDPTAVLASPSDGTYIKAPQNITGTATDPNFTQYRLEVSPGTAAEASRWSELAIGAQPVNNDMLLNWETLPPDGAYTLRLTVQDTADNSAQALTQIIVDTHPPVAPLNLAATLGDANNARLTWNVSTDSDLAGYAVYRDGVRITANLISDVTYYDANLIDGRYVYTVKAVDRAGWESEVSNEAVIVMDVTPPVTRISSPSSGSAVSGFMDIKGTAYSTDDFKEYRLYVASGAAPTDYQLLVRSPVPILADILSQWNTLVLEEGADFTLKLEAEDINGNVGVDRITVKIDNMPPAAPTGLVATANGSNVTLTWNANTESDLLGYLVFRDERLANLSGVLVGSLKPYAIFTTSYADLSLGDGIHTYYLLAVDKAGNISDPSGSVEVSIDTRAPHAVIVRPAESTTSNELGGLGEFGEMLFPVSSARVSFDTPLYILAESPDTDIASVRFQWRSRDASAWIDLGEPDTSLPYETTFDPASLGLEYGYYDLQAVATDYGNMVDPMPTPITVDFKDVSPPSATRGLTTMVDGGQVKLTWTANIDADLAGYHVNRRNSDGNTVRLTPSPITQSSFIDSNVADGTYSYTIVAVDERGNNADPSTASQAIVYTPQLTQPFTPTTDTMITLNGQGIGSAVVSGYVTSTSNSTQLTPVNTDELGNFTSQVSLSYGLNTISVRLTDSFGNVSKPSSVDVVSSQAPSKPTGLAADVTGYDVALTWNPNPETDILGYRLFRDGLSLLSDAPVTGLTADASSYYWNNPYAYPYKAVDSDLNSYWSPMTSDTYPSAGQWLSVNLPTPRIVASVTLRWSFEDVRAIDFDIEAGFGSGWFKVAEVRGNTTAETTVILPKPYLTQKLRLVLRKNSRPDNFAVPVQLSDFKVFYLSLESTSSSHDVATDGVHGYSVSAVNIYGFESEQSDLSVGVGDVTPPEPLELSATPLGSDVVLSWLPSTAPDLAYYTVYRDGALIATLSDTAATQYLDAALVNGTYRYVVKATDIHNNESLPSNDASATVAGVLPSAPVALAVTSIPSGGTLHLTWQPGEGLAATGYRIYRALVANGPYEQIATLNDSQYLDTGLTNHVSYYYVVAAFDTLGNVSAYSNEGNGMPRDEVALVAITYPTTPGNGYVTNSASATVAGMSEAGATINVYRNGASSGSATATNDTVVANVALTLSSYPAPLSPTGRYMAVHRTGSITLYDFDTRAETVISNHQYIGNPALNWSRDGTRLYFVDYDESAARSMLRMYSLASGTLDTVIDSSVFTNLYGAIISGDGSRFAVYGIKDGIYGLWLYELATRTTQLLKAKILDIGTLCWSPNGRKLAYIVPGRRTPTKVEIADVESGVITLLEQTAVTVKPSWSADGSQLLYAALDNGAEQVWRYSLADNVSEVMTQGPDTHSGASWLPDNSGFTSVQNGLRVMMHDRNGAVVNTLIEDSGLDGRYAEWVGSDYFAIRNVTGVVRITPAGRFELRGVALDAGDNTFTAVAHDASGNISVPSMPVIVSYDIGDQPDLTLSALDIRALPSPAVIGNTTNISVTVHNAGTATSSPAKLTLMTIDEQGNGDVLLSDATVSAMSPQGTYTLQAEWTPEVAGAYTLVATVDPMNEIIESSESNNFALHEVMAAGESAPVISVALDRTVAGPNETLSGTATLSNSGDTVSGKFVISVEDEAGYVVQTLSSTPVTIAFGQTEPVPVNWSTGTTFAGTYRLSAQLVDAQGSVLAQDSKPFTLTGASEFTTTVATNLLSYGANSDVTVTGQATYQSGNTLVSDARLHLLLLDAGGLVVGEKTELLGDLMPGAENTITMTWNTGLAVGTYTTQLKVESGETILAQAQSTFAVMNSGPVLKGTLLLTDASPAPGTVQQVTYTVMNNGNGSATALPIRLALIDASGTVITSETRQLDLAAGGRETGIVSFATAGLALTQYQVLLQIESSATASYTTLASAGFTLVDRTAPAIAITAPDVNGYFSSNAQSIVYARDDLSSINLVEIRLDGATWLPAPVYSASQSLFATALPLMPEGAHQLEARATDTYGNTALAGTVTFIVDNTLPLITISGVANDGLYNYDVAAQVTISDTNLIENNVSLNGTAYNGALLGAEGDYQLAAQGRDAAGNTAQTTLWFAIDKTAPTITITGVEEGGLYRAAVTPVLTISDPHLQTESVTLNGEPFAAGSTIGTDGVYTLVATAADGASNSSSASISFEVDMTPPAAPVVTHPAEGETVNARLVDVIGTSEANATVYLEYNNTEVAAFTDVSGTFHFPQVSFNEGVNSFAVYAKDRAGNIGTMTTVNFNVVTADADLTGSVSAPTGVLVFLPNKQTAEKTPIQLLVESALNARMSDYLVVHDESAFVSALRTNRYGAVLMAETHPACDNARSDECHEQGSQLNLSNQTAYELRAGIAAGMGLVWIKPDSDANEHFSDVFGAKTRGLLPAPNLLTLETSPASDAGQWDISGVALNVKTEGGTVVGQLAPYGSPALVLNTYGNGPVALVTFDPAGLTNTQAAQEIIDDLVSYTTPMKRALVPGGLAEIRFRAAKLRAPVTVRFDELVTSPVTLEQAIDGTITSPIAATWTRELVTSEAEFTSLVRLPGASGRYESTGTLSELREGSPLQLKSHTLEVILNADRDELAANAMDALIAFDVAHQYVSNRDRAIELVHEAIMLPQTSNADTEKSMTLLLDAVKTLQTIPGSAVVVGEIGRLLQSYQLAWK